MHFGIFYFFLHIFLKCWLRPTEFISPPTHGNTALHNRQETESKGEKKRVGLDSTAMGLDSLGIWHVVWLF